MSTYAIHFIETDSEQIKRLLDFVRSLDFVHSVEPALTTAPRTTAEQEAAAVPTSGSASISDIKTRYPDQWVLLANPQRKGTILLGGQVLAHDHDKRAFALKSKDLLKEHPGATHFFTGKVLPIAHSDLARKVVAR